MLGGVSAITLTAMADAHHQDQQFAAPQSNSPLRAETAAGLLQSSSIASTNRSRSTLGNAASAFDAERLIRNEQRNAQLSPVENRVGRLLQGRDPAGQILDVV